MNEGTSTSTRLMMDRARSAVLSRDFTLAARLYKNLLKEEPTNKELLSALGDLYQRSGNDSQAIPLYNQIVQANPNDVVALNNLGSIYRRLKKYDESIAVLEKAVIVDESNVQTFYNLGFTYKLMGKNESAIQCFNTVVEENPNDVLAYNHLGAIYAAEREYDKSISSYQRGLKVDPNHPILHLNLAQCYEKVGSLDLAVNEYEAALRSKPGWRDATDGYVDLLVRKNDITAALELVNQAIRLNPQDAEMHAKIGDIYTLITDFDSAEMEYNVTLKCNPANVHALSALARVYDLHGNHSEALKIMARYAEVKHDDSDMLKLKASVMMGSGKLHEAAGPVKELWDRNSDDVEMLSLLAQYYIMRGEESKAEGCLKKSRRLDAEYVDYFRDYAKRYRQLQKYERAIRNLEVYLKEKEFDSETLYLLAKCYEETKQYEKALYQYKKISDYFGMESIYDKAQERLQKQMELDGVDKRDQDIDFDALEMSMQEELGLERSLVEEEVTESPEIDENIEPVIEFEPMDQQHISDAQNKMNWGDRGYTFEKLTHEDSSGGSPFDRHLDDDIFASNSKKGEFDNLVPGAEKEDEDDIEDNFFDGNPFGKMAPRKAPEEDLMEDNFLDEDIEGKKRKPEDAVTELTDGSVPTPKNPAPVSPAYPVNDKPASGMPSSGNPAAAGNGDADIDAGNLAPASGFEDSASPLDNPFAAPGEPVVEPEVEPADELSDDPFMSGANEIPPIEPAAEEPTMEDDTPSFEDGLDDLDLGQDQELRDSLSGDEEDFFADSKAEEEPENNYEFAAENVQEESGDTELDDIQVDDEGLLDEDENTEDDVAFVPETVESDLEDVENLEYDDAEETEEPALESGDELPSFEEEAVDENEEIPSVETVVEETELSENSELSEDKETIPVDADETEIHEETETVSAEDSSDKLSADLFIKLRALSEYLPVDKKLEFQDSRESLMLDYIIRKLSGEPGLLETAQEVRDNLHIQDEPVDDLNLNQTADVISGMKSYLASLPDRKLAHSLQNQMDGAIKRLTDE
ncbi:MAG: tetratricopeptide repeat protein [Treponema sp.]|nr:tetratricopeptide repeat protein [Treponema sp.]